jgi:ABC-2 type transport system ATP-binding protein
VRELVGDHDDGQNVGNAIKVSRLRKSYGGIESVHGISFNVRESEIVACLGTNGAGKTTTMEILAGCRTRNSGQVTVLGRDPGKGGRDWRNRLGLLLEGSQLDPAHTVLETVTMYARYFSCPSGPEDCIATVGLTDCLGKRVGRLSAGQKRRVEIAIALVGNPDVLLLDEPTTGLDPLARRQVWDLLDELRTMGTTVFLTTHLMAEAEAVADRVIVLRSGKIVGDGTVSGLKMRSERPTKVTFRLGRDTPERVLQELLGVEITTSDTRCLFSTQDVQSDLKRLLDWAAEEDIPLAGLEAIGPTLDDLVEDLVAGETAGHGGLL